MDIKRYIVKAYRSSATTKRLAAALLLSIASGVYGAAYAAECSPLQVSRFDIFDATKIQPGGTGPITGVQFRVKTTLRNTNRTRAHSGHPNDQAVLRVLVDRHRDSLGNMDMGVQKYPSGLRAGGHMTFNSRWITVMRNPNNLPKFTADIEAWVHNAGCEKGKNFSHTLFEYDLNPILQGRQPRRLSARVTGYSEAARPRPQKTGSGAPRPRSRN